MKLLLKCMGYVEDTTRIITIVAMTVLVFIQVVARIFFEWSSPSMEEAARFIMIWSIFIGAIVTTREDSHIKMSGVIKNETIVIWVELASKLACFMFMIIFNYWAYEYAAYSISKSMRSVALGMDLIIVHSCFLVCGTFIAIHFLVHLLNHIVKIKTFYKGAL